MVNRGFIKEMSVVGLPDDDGGEKIAALVVPDYEHDIALVACRGEQEGRGAFSRGLGGAAVLQTRQRSCTSRRSNCRGPRREK